MSKLSIIIPCYFEELNINDTYFTIKKEVMDVRTDIDYEIILVDDGSTDNTIIEAKKVQIIDPRVRIVKFSRNFGEFRADVAGMEVATGDVVTVISCDLQDPPELILQMLESWEKGNKVNICVRNQRDEPWIKNFFANTYYKCVRKWVNKDYPNMGFDFFLIDKEIKDKLVAMQEKNSSIYLQLIWLGYNPILIEYRRKNREKGESNWSYRNRVNLFIDTFIVFSKEPIRFISKIGLFIGLIGIIFSLYTIGSYFYGGNLDSLLVIVSLLLVLFSVLMVMVGVVGEYVWRIMHETQKRPLYIIDEIIESSETGEKHENCK